LSKHHKIEQKFHQSKARMTNRCHCYPDKSISLSNCLPKMVSSSGQTHLIIQVAGYQVQIHHNSHDTPLASALWAMAYNKVAVALWATAPKA
jgi:hypothetical protein